MISYIILNTIGLTRKIPQGCKASTIKKKEVVPCRNNP